ncbi:integrase core domain-containing protein [Neorhizobium galegae]|uniref:integrase core domain-containing protein n=1 Tax=Neorhizobium galegae TaxID=399 RepID=UPI001AEB20B8
MPQGNGGEQAELQLKIKDICQTRVRYGYRRGHVLLKRDGWPSSVSWQVRRRVPERPLVHDLEAARAKIEDWRRYYNELRPHWPVATGERHGAKCK